MRHFLRGAAKQYAFLQSLQGISIVDLNADPIEEVAYIAGTNGPWHDIFVQK